MNTFMDEWFYTIFQDVLDVCFRNNVLNNIFSLFVPVGIALCVVFATLDVADRIATVNFSTTDLLFCGIRLLIAVILISNLKTILDLLFDFTDGIALSLSTANAAGLATANTEWNSLMLGVESSMGNIIRFLTQFYVLTVAFTRAFKISIKTAVAPIAVPDVYKNGLSSNGMKFIKGLFADYMQIIFIFVVLDLASILMSVTPILTTYQPALMNLLTIGYSIPVLGCIISMLQQSETQTQQIFM